MRSFLSKVAMAIAASVPIAALTGVPAPALASATVGRAVPAAAHSGLGAVYTETNAASGNAVLRYIRSADGTLSPGGTFSTGGLGSGAGLGSQGALVESA